MFWSFGGPMETRGFKLFVRNVQKKEERLMQTALILKDRYVLHFCRDL